MDCTQAPKEDTEPKDDNRPLSRWSRWYRKVKQDPEQMDRLRASWREHSASYRARIDADPERKARRKELDRIRHAKKYVAKQTTAHPKRKPRERTEEQREKNRQWQREHNQKPETKAAKKAYRQARKQDPEYRKKRNAKLRQIRSRREDKDPTARERRLAYMREYNKAHPRPHGEITPEKKARRRELDRIRHAKKRAQQDAAPAQEPSDGTN